MKKEYGNKFDISSIFGIPRGSLNRLLQNRDENGLAEHVRMLGKKKLLIHIEGFKKWIDRYSGEKRNECPIPSPFISASTGGPHETK